MADQNKNDDDDESGLFEAGAQTYKDPANLERIQFANALRTCGIRAPSIIYNCS